MVEYECTMIRKLFPQGKKGINDISIITIIVLIFLGSSLIIPFLNDEFGTTGGVFNNDKLTGEIQDGAKKIPEASAFDTDAFTVITTTIKLAFFDVGNSLELPFWLDLLYTVLAIVLILTIARNVWIGGGS